MEMFERMPMLRDVQLLGTQASSTDSQDSVERKHGLAIYCSTAAARITSQDVRTVFASGARLRYFDNPGWGTTLDVEIPGETKNLLEVLSSNLMTDIDSPDGLTKLAASRVADERLDWIAKLRNLRSLQLIRPSLSADAYGRLASELELESLRLGDCHLSEQMLAKIANMHSLRKLDIDSSATLDIAGLTHLARLSQLVELRIWGVAMGDEDQAIARLRALSLELPKCEIRTDLPIADAKPASVVR